MPKSFIKPSGSRIFSCMKTYNVVAAIILKDGKVLCSQRGYGEFKDKWEFPGGKIEQGETETEALIREIKEELGADIKVEDHLCDVHYDYPSFHLDMHCYICFLLSDLHPDKEIEEANVFVSFNELDDYDFLPADIEVVNKLKAYLSKRGEVK